jgi:hypothetical protein
MRSLVSIDKRFSLFFVNLESGAYGRFFVIPPLVKLSATFIALSGNLGRLVFCMKNRSAAFTASSV